LATEWETGIVLAKLKAIEMLTCLLGNKIIYT